MSKYNTSSIFNFAILIFPIVFLLSVAMPLRAQSGDENLIKGTVVSSELLKSPVNRYLQLSAKTDSLDSPADILQLALTQHLLGLHLELKDTLKRLQTLNVSQRAEWEILYFFLVGADASKNAQYEQSSASLHYAKKLAEKTSSKHLWVLVTQELAFNEALQEHFETAFLLLQEAYLQAQQEQWQFEQALVEQALGGVYSYADNYEQANQYYQQALTRYKALQFPAYIAETLLGIATTFRHQKKWAEALQAYENYGRALNFQGTLGNAFYYHYGKAITLALSGRCVEATEEIDAAVKAQGPRDYLGELYKKQAICAVQMGLITVAETALSNAQEIIDATPGLIDTLWQAELVMIESDIAEISGRLPQALDLYRKYHSMTSRLQAKKSSERLVELRVSMESERKDAQIQQLQQQSELQSLEIIAKTAEEHRNILIIGCAVLILLMLTGIIFFQRRKTQHLYELSVHDPLTNLFNRRHAIGIVEYWLSQSRSERQTFSVFIIDVDNFKLINDTYGHSVGDKLLNAIASVSLTVIRPSDVLARFGGEEFICVLPRISTSEAEAIAEHIRNKIAETTIKLNNDCILSRTVSIGIAHVNYEDTDINAVLERADKAMYRAKNTGRDRVCVS